MLFQYKSSVKNAIFLDFRAFYALKCVYFKAFCSFRQVIFNSNANFDIENYTKTIPILIQWKEEKSNFISEMLFGGKRALHICMGRAPKLYQDLRL